VSGKFEQFITDADEIRDRAARGEGRGEIARALNVSRRYVDKVISQSKDFDEDDYEGE